MRQLVGHGSDLDVLLANTDLPPLPQPPMLAPEASLGLVAKAQFRETPNMQRWHAAVATFGAITGQSPEDWGTAGPLEGLLARGAWAALFCAGIASLLCLCWALAQAPAHRVAPVALPMMA